MPSVIFRERRAHDLDVFYNGTDITSYVTVRSCVVRDTASDRCDSLDIEFENAGGWDTWAPKEDDTISVYHNGYDSGIMFVNTVIPKDGNYRIFATSLPCKARNKGYASFRENTLEEIVRKCAVACGMDYAFYGTNKDVVIPYIERNNEGCAAFLYKLLALEGSVLKCVNGKFTAIDILYAQERDALQTLEIASDQDGVEYAKNGLALRKVTIMSPYAEASAVDSAVEDNHNQLVISSGLPVLNNAQAGRWARGKLLHVNRKCESLHISNTYNLGFTAMERVDVSSIMSINGSWIIEEVEHDLFNLKTTATMRRCIDTII